jgi:glycerophosphoryl diester phosphodiesterase
MLVVALIPLVYYGLYFILRGPLPSDPQLIAHRGGPVYEPENTIAAFRNAIKVGADWIEMDIQRTKDGELVVIHDETVDRTTDGTGRVEDLTLEQIRALDAGNGEHVPTFEQVIAIAEEAAVGLLPEAKSPHLYPGIESDMVNALIENRYLQETVIQSFDLDVLDTIQRMNADIQVCPLYGLWGLDLSDPQPSEANTLCPMAEMVILNPWMIRQAHAEGREVFVWFGAIEHPIIMRLILAFGADGLMIDDPVALAEVLDR